MANNIKNHTSWCLSNIESQSVGVDWLTCTQIREVGVSPLLGETKKVVSEMVARGNDRMSWKGQGYFGERAGGASWGVRGDSYLSTLSSDTAREFWLRVGRWATNCTRIDLQVTQRLSVQDLDAFDRLEQHLYSRPGGRGKPVAVTRIRDSKGGNTVYLGSRSSDVYMRVYDKGVELKTEEPGVLIRFEVELKRALAKRALANLLENPTPEAEMAGIVAGYFGKRSVSIDIANRCSLEVARVENFSDSQRRLIYLAKVVRPMVARLKEAGLSDAAMAVLFAERCDTIPLLAEETKPYWRD